MADGEEWKNPQTKPVGSIRTFYEIEKRVLSNIVRDRKIFDSYMDFSRQFQPGNIKYNNWRNICIDAVVDGWIEEDKTFRYLYNMPEWKTKEHRIIASYRHGVDYVLHNGIWNQYWIDAATEIESKNNGEGRE